MELLRLSIAWAHGAQCLACPAPSLQPMRWAPPRYTGGVVGGGHLLVLVCVGRVLPDRPQAPLCRAVVGGHQEAVLALAQRGAAVDATGVVHEEEEHLERPLLTAAHRGDLDMMRLLIQVRYNAACECCAFTAALLNQCVGVVRKW